MQKPACFTLAVLATSACTLLTAQTAFAECSLSREVCRDVYTCIEYYPNGTDCRKTVKTRECETVCDDFDVDRGGIDDANRNIAPQLMPDDDAAGAD